MAVPTRLRVEHLDEALGTDVRAPRLSWWLPAGSLRQSAYRIRTQDWDSGWVESDQSVLVPYAGPVPAPGQRCVWQVKVRTDLGESDWSQPSSWEPVLDVADWTAAWIEPAEDTVPEAGRRPAYLLRHEFTLDAAPTTARVYATAHGVYELFVNGTRVGDQELAPGFTAYGSRLMVQTYDVTALLRPGANAIGAVLSDGWFRGQITSRLTPDAFGSRTALLAQLRATTETGDVTMVGTGPGWRSTRAEITAADLMDGQRTDFRLAVPGWSEPGADDSAWSKAVVAQDGLYAKTDRLAASPAPPVRRVQALTPVAITAPRPGVQVVDFGQNINGWVRLNELGPQGTELTLTHGETLGPDGDVTLDHLFITDGDGTRGPDQRDQVVSSGRTGEVFEPRHTTHGFRYVRVEGHPGTLTPGDIEAVVVHTDFARTGWFRCSDERVNRLHEAALWSFRGNACDIPTDCPQRERDGWTGDWQIFVPTAAFLYDVAGFSAKWLRDLAADQWPDGRVPNVIPDGGHKRRGEDLFTYIQGSAGWGDAAVIVPWETYRAYGDEQVLADQYDSMVRWHDYAAGIARTGRWGARAEARPEPAAHEEFLWDSAFHYGEWCEPKGTHDTPFYAQDPGPIATAYLHYSSRLLAKTAAVLGRADDADRYRRYADNVLAAWRTEFIGPDGHLTVDTQANHVRALAFGLVPEHLREQTAARLVALIREAGTHLATGFLATPYLLPVLADTGHLDVAYELLMQDTEPSWLVMIDRGATTVWEDWDGIDADGTAHASLNHYSKGAVVSFLHRHTAGIRPREDALAYRHFDIRPEPGGGLTRAEAELDTPYGRISTRWSIEDGRFDLAFTVPPGTTATVTLPDGRTYDAGPGDHQDTCALGR
ncbi:family 78 glycoside hydrolase catalytic domain [Yinghuangia sp. YIM S10712]|uniref:family 78 glycoside hydrolase catalytic domain n=1 Tax=Yinghuangia sp. YIM S10712 TaxID=3436930 RepID=UPI003F537FFB